MFVFPESWIMPCFWATMGLYIWGFTWYIKKERRKKKNPVIRSPYDTIPVDYVIKNRDLFLPYAGDCGAEMRNCEYYEWYYIPQSKLQLAEIQGYKIYCHVQTSVYVGTLSDYEPQEPDYGDDDDF